jgi:hypothetical protein
VAIVDYIIELTAEDEESDDAAWRWLRKLLELLTADGMSSDNSETGIQGKVYRVTVMAWRRDVTKYMEYIDGQRNVGDKAGYSTRGATPRSRVRDDENAVSNRKHVDGLPRTLYNDSWFKKQHKMSVNVSREQFQWATIIAKGR